MEGAFRCQDGVFHEPLLEKPEQCSIISRIEIEEKATRSVGSGKDGLYGALSCLQTTNLR